MIKNFLAAIGMVGLIAGLVGCALIFMFLGARGIDRAPGILEQGLATIDATKPDDGVRFTEVQVVATVPPPPTRTPLPPTPTSTPEPTRPAIEKLPLGEGPYKLEQMEICRDVWAQRLQAELTIHQFGYCQGVVNRGS